MVAPVEVIDQVVMAKQGMDLHTSTFTQMLAYEVVKDGFLDEHIRLIRRVYKERRQVMLDALERYFPEGCSWTRPDGGLFLWARVPDWMDMADMLQEAVRFKVAYVPGFAFYCDPNGGRNTMRLNFSCEQPEKIEEGIRRLGEMLKQHVADHEPKVTGAPGAVPAAAPSLA
jgi:2-aminoadipate transaminase